MSDGNGALPEGWEWSTLKEIVSSITYGHTASATDEPVGPRFLRITDIQNGRVNWDTVPYCKCDDLNKYALKNGDIVIARTGATTGKSFLIGDLAERSVFASYRIRLETLDDLSAVTVQILRLPHRINVPQHLSNDGTKIDAVLNKLGVLGRLSGGVVGMNDLLGHVWSPVIGDVCLARYGATAWVPS